MFISIYRITIYGLWAWEISTRLLIKIRFKNGSRWAGQLGFETRSLQGISTCSFAMHGMSAHGVMN